MKKIVIVGLVLSLFVACKATERVGVVEDASVEAPVTMATEPVEPVLSVPAVSVSASAPTAPASVVAPVSSK